MNKKIYFLSFAAAAMFASCSNEIDEFAQQTSQQGFKVGITIDKNAPETRLALSDDGNTATWELGDKFSLFNVGTPALDTDLTATANAAYKTTDGENFASENVLFNGDHALVFPLNTSFVTSGAEVFVAPITKGETSLGNRSVYLSKTLVEITNDGLKDEKGNKLNKNQSGYNKDIKVAVRPATTAFVLNLKQANQLAITENDPALKITKVQLVALADKTPFATKAKLQEQNIEYKDSKFENRLIAVPAELATTAEVTYDNLPFEANGTTVRIVALPNTAAITANYAIKVYTNYGVVTINKAAMVSRVKDGKTLIQLATPAEKTNDNKDGALSFDTEAAALATAAAKGNAVPNVMRDVTVDMSTADINGLEIKNSEQLLAAFRAYDLLKKTTATFTLTPKDGVFTLTKAAVDAINAHKYNNEKGTGANIQTSATTIILTGYGTDAYNAIPAISQISGKNLILAAGNNWAIDVHSAANANAFTSICNKGTMQISMSGWNDKTSVKLNKAVENDGTIVFGGNVNMPTAINDTYVDRNSKSEITGSRGTLTVADGQTVKLQGGATMTYSTINIGSTAGSTAILASSKGTEFSIGNGTTTNVYGSLLNESGATLNNAGTINIKDAMAGVIISANSGTINVTAKDNLVNVDANTGYIKLPVSGDFTVNAANMGIANYVVYSGSKMTISASGYYVEFCENAVVSENIKDAEANVVEFNVASGKMVTIPTGSDINATKTTNNGTIRVYGTFDAGTVTKGADQIYKF